MNYELVTSKSVMKADELPVSLHKSGCAGSKREIKQNHGSIWQLKATTLEAAKQEAFVEGGLEECGYSIESGLDVHSCCKETTKKDSAMTDVEMSDWLRGKDLNERLWGGGLK